MQQAPIIFLAFANEAVDSDGRLRNLSLEHTRIRDILEPAKRAGLCRIIERPNATIEEIRAVFKEHPNQVSIFHYGGHANSHQLLLNSADRQNMAIAHSAGLVSFLAERKGLQLVYLNGCSTKEIAVELVEKNGCCVIGTSNSVNDEVARKMAVEFYKSIALKYDVSQAWKDVQSMNATAYGTANMRSFIWEGMDFEENDTSSLWDLYGENALGWKLQEIDNLTVEAKNTIINEYIIDSLDYKKLSEEMQDIRDILETIPEDKVDLRNRQLEKLKELQQQEQALKDTIFKLHESFTRINLNTDRLKKAKAHFDKGEFREADEILNANEMESDLANAIAQEEEAEKKLLEAREIKNNLMEEFAVKARLWQTFYKEPDWEQKAIGFYEKSLEIGRNVNTLSDYAYFMDVQHHSEKAFLLYEEILEIYRGLAHENPDTYRGYLAWVLNNIGISYANRGMYEKAEEAHAEALEIRRALFEKNPDYYLNDLGHSLNNLAVLHTNLGSFKKAEEGLMEALEIRTELVRKDSKLYLSDLAFTLNQLGYLYLKNGMFDQAEEYCAEAEKVYRDLASKDYQKHVYDLSNSIGNLGYILVNLKRNEEAEKLYDEYLSIRKALAQENAKRYFPDVIWVLNNLASLHETTGATEKASQERAEAEALSKKLELLSD